MPELPDLTIYVEALERTVVGHRLERLDIISPSLLKTFEPPVSALEGRTVASVRRMGKRLVFEFVEETTGGVLLVAVHLMIAGRLRWKKVGTKLSPRMGHAAWRFAHGTLILTEASSRKRAQLHVLADEAALAALDAGGVEPLDIDAATFTVALRMENRTLKRALTDPRILAGVGNAYSDEALHRACLSPVTLTSRLSDEECAHLHAALVAVLTEWAERLRAKTGDKFPDKVTAFHDEMAVHGKFGQPCPVCGDPVQRIVRADNEVNYCATCQTAGKVLADRAISRLLGKDWPRTLEELEEKLPDRARRDT